MITGEQRRHACRRGATRDGEEY